MNKERLTQILLAPVVTEKSSLARMNHNQIVLKVRRDATKPEIRQAVEGILGARVKSVSTMNVKGKAKRFKGRLGRQSDWKKAYVTLAPGQDVELPGS